MIYSKVAILTIFLNELRDCVVKSCSKWAKSEIEVAR